MREIAVMIAVSALCVGAVASPIIGILGYVWFSLTRPDIFAYGIRFPLSYTLALVTCFSAVRAAPMVFRRLGNWVVVVLFITVITFTASAFTAVNPALAQDPIKDYLRMVLMALLLPLLIENRKHLIWTFLVMAVSIGMLGFKFGSFGVVHGGVKFGAGYGGNVSDNNLLALGLVTGLPLVWYSRVLVTKKWMKWGLVAVALFNLAAIAMLMSRGAYVAGALVLFCMVWRSKRRALAIIGLLVLLVPSVILVGGRMKTRVESIGEYDSDASAKLRLYHWQAALRMSADYPLLGVGFGMTNFQNLNYKYMDDPAWSGYYAHNNYLQILADSGYPALFFYCCLLFGCIVWLNKHAKLSAAAHDPELWAIANGLQIALIGFAVGSFFLSRSIYDFPYFIMMTVAATLNVVREERYVEAQASYAVSQQPMALPTAGQAI